MKKLAKCAITLGIAGVTLLPVDPFGNSVEIARLENENAMLRKELRIKDEQLQNQKSESEFLLDCAQEQIGEMSEMMFMYRDKWLGEKSKAKDLTISDMGN